MTQPKNNPNNDRAKRDYLVWLREAKQRSALTVEQVRHAIDRFKNYNNHKDFGSFNKDQAVGFKRALTAETNARTGKPLSIATVHHTLVAVKDFLAWLQCQPEYRKRVKPHEISYLNLGTGEERQTRAREPKGYPTLEEYRKALFSMPDCSDTERRDQALMALVLLTGMRDATVVTLKLRHVRLDRTRFSKTLEKSKQSFARPLKRRSTPWETIVS